MQSPMTCWSCSDCRLSNKKAGPRLPDHRGSSPRLAPKRARELFRRCLLNVDYLKSVASVSSDSSKQNVNCRVPAGKSMNCGRSGFFTRCGIHQSLALRGFDRGFRSRAVRLTPPVPTVGKFIAVSVQVLFAHFVINAIVTAFDQREETLCRIRGNPQPGFVRASVLPLTVRHEVMTTGEVRTQVPVTRHFVRHDRRLLLHVLDHFVVKRRRIDELDRL